MERMGFNNIDPGDIHLSSEQEEFIAIAMQQKNILVDACVGSGKTTAIQYLCNALPSDKSILYLTYNRLLKIDAKSKIKNKNVFVTNYHGFASWTLNKIGIKVAQPELIQRFIHEKPQIPVYDVLIIDEYQDIEQELADLLTYIKETNRSMQIIAVGDMRQKIYDKTTLDARQFICTFLEEHVELSFTNCFRLSADFAQKLGRVWDKTIIGVNQNCLVETMSREEVAEFLSNQSPRDILCLGARKGDMTDVLNILENCYPDKFNKKTVYASISDTDDAGATQPNSSCAIFTTFDSSKGLERKICVVFDFTESYWAVRIEQPLQSYEILRNIFCVAASRGKERIIFVKNDEALLSETTLKTKPTETNQDPQFNISTMFDFKYREDIEECYSLLAIKTLQPPDERTSIKINNKDGLIDLSPCIGIYQEAMFFSDYDIDSAICFHLAKRKRDWVRYHISKDDMNLDSKILYLTALETKQDRYKTQVKIPFVSSGERDLLMQRLSEQLPQNAAVQLDCLLRFPARSSQNNKLCAVGRLDAFYNNVVYELKFVSELKHEYFLQCACYVLALGVKTGRLWNTRNNAMYEIEIPDREAFLDCVLKTITKRKASTPTPASSPQAFEMTKHIAIIDTETNFSDQAMSIGVVIADARTYSCVDYLYRIIDPEWRVLGMYTMALQREQSTKYKDHSATSTRNDAISTIKNLLDQYQVKHIFAYNAKFDFGHLPEFSCYTWYDIMGLAAYRQHNNKIPDNAECCKSGRLKCNYGVEKIMQLLSGDTTYRETHNALLDAIDELKIMRLLGHSVQTYHNSHTANKLFAIESKSENCNATTVSKVLNNNNAKGLQLLLQNDNANDSNKQNDEYIYTVNDVCREIKKSKSTVYNLIHNGTLSAIKISNKFYISKTSFEKYKKNLRFIQILSLSSACVIILFIIIYLCVITHI